MSGASSPIAIVSVVAALAAAASAFFAGVALRRNSKAVRLQVLESILRDIRDLDTDPPQQPRKLFNTIEYLSFVVNRRLIPGAELADFYRIGIVHWYEQVFPKHEPDGYRDPAAFVEFKRLYEKLKAWAQRFRPVRWLFYLS